MMTTPYKPRDILKIDAAIFRELILSKRALAIFPKDSSKRIRFFESTSSGSIDKHISFLLKVGTQKVDLSIELKPETLLFKRIEEVGGVESLPEEFRTALITFAGKEIIDVLENLFQLPVAIWSSTDRQKEPAETKELFFEILGANDQCEGRASMILEISLIERILAVANETPIIKNNLLTGELLQGELLIGSATLTLRDWQRIKPGDLIVIEEPSALTTGQGKCLIKKCGIIPIILKPDYFKPLILSLEKIFPNGFKGVPPAAEQSSLKENTLDPSIPLELNFSAGLISLTIDETLRLVKTKSLQKPFQTLKPLNIFLREQVVGTGELLEINGRYAIAVTQLFTYAS